MKNNNLYSLLPKVDELLANDKINQLIDEVPRRLIVDSIREAINTLREDISSGKLSREILEDEIDNLPEKICGKAMKNNQFNLRRVVNATGVVVHTNLGRSLISNDIIDNIRDVSTNYSNLEFDLLNGTRGSRYSHLESIICDITGSEAAMVVNNNAAAVMLVLSTLAKGKEVIVSRGELIEIGGSFRIPDVMEQSGARLVEVGTTNKTHLRDYENKISEDTAAFLKVHTSNYRILGFTSDVDASELRDLRDKYNIPVIEDLGSGVLIDLSKYKLGYEPTVQESLNNGVDIVTFSGDKLLGGPQAGIIVGKKKYIDNMKLNPLTRAFRVDKFTIIALESIFRYYLDEDRIIGKIPTLNMLTMDLEEIHNKAKDLLEMLNESDIRSYMDINIEDSFSEVGGGSLPLEKLPTKCIVFKAKDIKTGDFEEKLREYTIPIITRVYKDNIYIDLRTIRREEFPIIVEGIDKALKKIKEQ